MRKITASKESDFSMLRGLTIKEIIVNKTGYWDESIVFVTDKGRIFKMHHNPSCCETVLIHDIVGDMDAVLNSPILQAEKSCSDNDTVCHSELWTFYRLATVNGFLTISWYGESNGQYTVEVSFDEDV